MKIKINQAFLDLLSERRIYTGSGRGHRWKVGDILTVDDDAEIEPYAHLLEGAMIPRRMGAFSYSHSPVLELVSVGRYCSIGHKVVTMGAQHPTDWASSSRFSYHAAGLNGVGQYYADRGVPAPDAFSFEGGSEDLVLGNDVWIGGNALLKRGITIGDGAIIAAGAIVTKDVEPYAIVGGVPARLIRYRFSHEVIEELLASRWWDYGPEVLMKVDVRRPEGLRDRLADAVAGGARPLLLRRVTARDMIRAVEPNAA